MIAKSNFDRLSLRQLSPYPPSPSPHHLTSSSDLSEDPKVAKENFDSLMRSRMIESKFLIDRAKKIYDRVDVEGEMGKLRILNLRNTLTKPIASQNKS